jgi:hypothetical protein
MNNYSDTRSLTIDPVKFLEFEEPEILYKLINELGYSEEEALVEFHSMTSIISHLMPLRNSKSKTDDYLKETLKLLRYRSKLFIIMFLLAATEVNDTYCHAYNCLVYYANRYLHLNITSKKIIETELFILLENEKTTIDLPETVKQFRTFKTFLSPEELNTIRLRLIKDEQISKISEADFKYLFSAQPIQPEMVKICWKDSISLCHEFLARLVFIGSKFNYRQANSCIFFKNGNKISSSYKSRAQYKNDDFFSQLLNF